MKIAVVVGGRPNYIKMAPIVRAMDADSDLECILVDAAQHYSANMREIFFEEVGLRDPDFRFTVGGTGKTQAWQTATAITEFEHILEYDIDVDAVLVHGDMNYALGCALAATKLHIPVIHNEAGLRSFDRRMPEEINRILIDHIAMLHLLTEPAASNNLRREGICSVERVGSTLYESMQHVLGNLFDYRPPRERCCVVTLHRPESVDDPKELLRRIDELEEVAEILPVKMIVHPRTKERIRQLHISSVNFDCLDPLGYGDMLRLMMGAKMVITDSGGIQEETTILGVPCLTWRDNTERPITCDTGTNVLAIGNMALNVRTMLDHPSGPGKLLELWDGHASERIVEVLKKMKGGV